MKIFTAALCTSFTLVCAPAEAQRSAPTIDQKGIMHCDRRGNNVASDGKMPTDFANRYWSHLGCGRWEEANKILEEAPKVWDRAKMPTEEMKEAGNKIAKCYFDSFAYGPFYHARQQTPEGLRVHHGFYGFSADDFSKVERAVLFACTPHDLS